MKRFCGLAIGLITFTVMVGWTGFLYAAPLDDVIAAAKKEGTLEFHAPSTLTIQGAEAIGAAVNKKYGVNIKMNYNPSSSMTSDVGKVVGMAATGIAPQWDLMVVTDAHHATLWFKKLHQAYNYRALGVDPKMIQYDGGAVSFAHQFVLPAYNKKLVPAKDIPQSWEDLLDPKWKGKLGMATTTHHLARLAAGPWGEEKTTNFVKALARQDLMLGRMGEIFSRMLLGEVLVAVTLTDDELKTDRNKTAPVAHAEKVEPVVAPAYLAGVPKGAKHPNAAHLFAVFLTTAEGQKIWEQYGKLSSAFVPGTTAYKYAQGKKLVFLAQEQAATVERLAKEYGKILGFGGI